MTSLIDTSSLLAFVRYYLPFDRSGRLRQFLRVKYENGEILVLDKVVEESKYVSKGIILDNFPYLTDAETKGLVVKTHDLVPTKKFFNLLENQFSNQETRRLFRIPDEEWEVQKTKHLNGADAKLLLYALSNKTALNPIIVTEETSTANDNKLFKKIPDCCKEIGIDCETLPTLFETRYGLDLGDLLSGSSSAKN